MKPKKITWLILIFAIVAAMLTACKDESEPNFPENQIDNIEETADIDDGKLKPELPEEDFGGHVFTVLAHYNDNVDEWYSPEPREIVAEISDTAEPINDAVYYRNELIKNRYNIGINMVAMNIRAEVTMNLFAAGDDVYDAVLYYVATINVILPHKILTLTSDLPYVDLTRPWWDPAVSDGLSILNQNFFLGGDMLILDNEATNALLFNKKMMTNNGLEYPYDMVKEGKWTIDAMNRMIKSGVSDDLNGDGKMTVEDDRWGLIGDKATIHALLVAGGGALAVKDNDDIPFLSVATPRNLTVLDQVLDTVYNQGNVFITALPNTSQFSAYNNVFEEDRALFAWVKMRNVEKFRGMDSDFGILPLPKFDEAQENYYSSVDAWTGALLAVPGTARNLERTSIILEALAAESKYTLRPAYYDITLQRKFARDVESAEMLDIIFGSRVYDVGAYHIFGLYWDFYNLRESAYRNIQSWYDKRAVTTQKNIDSIVDAFR